MSRSCFSWAAASHQHFQGAKSLTRSPHPWLSCSPRHLPALGFVVWVTAIPSSSHPTIPNLFHRPTASNPSVFSWLEACGCAWRSCLHIQLTLCRELPWEPRAAFAILLLIKRKKRKPLSITSLLNNLLPQVTTDRILNDRCAGNHVPKDPRGEITGFS